MRLKALIRGGSRDKPRGIEGTVQSSLLSPIAGSASASSTADKSIAGLADTRAEDADRTGQRPGRGGDDGDTRSNGGLEDTSVENRAIVSDEACLEGGASEKFTEKSTRDEEAVAVGGGGGGWDLVGRG